MMKIIEIVVQPGHVDTVMGVGAQHEIIDQWIVGAAEDCDRQVVRMLVDDENRQAVIDSLQNILNSEAKGRIVLLPVEATLPRVTPRDPAREKGKLAGTTREELYHSISKNAELDGNFLMLVFLSTIVASIGLIENNVAVVIGAMVIAPLLGPNIALALATALGDTPLTWTSLKTNAAGLSLALLLSLAIGVIWPGDISSKELLDRSVVGLDSVLLALASGAAAVLSLTTGLSTVLVGVMVAVALLPPMATAGLMLGSGQYSLALGAGLLLAVNIVCVNLSAKMVFLFRGVRPRTWLEKRKAKQSMLTYISFWIVSLLILLIAIYFRDQTL
jgi:uncharacterized hydrophobic protein (TIGR00341 family)